MKFFTLKKFDKDEFERFIDFVNKQSDSEHIHIFLDSEWWETNIWEAITELINACVEKFSITIITAISAAFILALNVKCPIDILKGWYCMSHKGWWSVFIKDWFSIDNEFAEFQKEQLEAYSEDIDYMTDKERKDFNSWKDVYFNADRTWEILIYKWRKYIEEENIYKHIL